MLRARIQRKARGITQPVRARLSQLLRSQRYRQWLVAALAWAAALVTVTVAATLALEAVTLVRQQRVLECSAAASVAHMHDESCYDAAGRLVCPLQEREEHVHGPACYDADGSLVCGQEETTGYHTHGAGCFVEVSSLPKPRQLFDDAAGGVHVTVEAPEGAFPQETTMTVQSVSEDDVREMTDGALGKSLDGLTAVDITFLGPAGVEVNPEVPVTVTMTNGVSPTKDRFVVFHVGDEGEVGLVTQYAPTTPSQVSFKTDSFSIYVMAVKKLQQTITASDGRTYEVSVTYTEEAGLPEDVQLVVREIEESDSSFAGVFKRAKTAATSTYEDATVTNARFLDISLMKDGATLEPLAPVEVNIVLTSGIALSDATSVVHFVNSRKVEVVDAEVAAANDELETGVDVTFTTDRFSVFGVVEMTLEKFVLASDGQTYLVTATYGAAAGVPKDAELVVEEIVAPDGEDGAAAEAYTSYVSQAEAALGWDVGSSAYARLFDIKIVDRAGKKVELAAPVNVRIELADRETEGTEAAAQVVHFADGSDQPEVVQGARTDGDAVSFETQSFSVYAIIEAEAPATINIKTVEVLSDLNKDITQPFYLSCGKPTMYFTNELNQNDAFIEIANSAKASEWFFEIVNEANRTYRLYTMVNGEKKYVCNKSGNLVKLVSESEISKAVVFELSLNSDGTFIFKIANEEKYLQHSGSGNGIRFWSDARNVTNSHITLSYASSYKVPDDPYGLDGSSYGIAYHNETASSTSLGAEELTVGGKKRLSSIDMLMREDTVYNSGLMLVAKDADITTWTFKSVEQDKYYITTEVGGVTKYLTINGENVTLSGEPDSEHSVVRAVPGTGAHSGKYSFIVGAYTLNLPGGDTEGFNAATGSRETMWMNLVQKTEALSDADFTLYAAKKVSVSDATMVANGKQIIMYTRVWNDVTERYEFYVVDHDGSLLRCYDVGDAIKWIGNQRNSALWTFIEGTNGDGVVTYYYDLQNVQYEKYLYPLLKDKEGQPQVVSSEQPGLNLNGRQYDRDYTTVLVWDEESYKYVGLKVQNGAVVPCELDEADDFYFAVVTALDGVSALTTVKTIDSARYGITMKMIDFNNKISKDRDSVQYEWFGGEGVQTGLLSTNLGEDGYPTRTSNTKHDDNKSLANLFSGMTEVNNLFIESVYNESGYFEYDSTQNFAHLNDDGTFTVYDQIGAITGSNEHKNTREHGQFMPYDDISAEKGYAIDSSGKVITAQTDVLKNPLPDSNPRKGEKMYNIGSTKTVDYFFGMEMSASFSQTPNGLDAWGHDIIFEFSGDDDFWFYVDGELVLDLGGVHEAQAGSINFRTGEVVSTYNVGNQKVTTLYEVFKSNFESRGLSDEAVQRKLKSAFYLNEEGNYVFKDYSSHTMRMFYMERGAGASNLHMRFNLAAVRPGTFLLSKKLSGTEVTTNSLIEFPYQIWYYTQDDAEKDAHLLDNEDMVHYEGTNTKVKHAESFTPVGGDTYDHVFFLKPGEKAEVELPEGATTYYVVECGVNTNIYDKVTANSTELTGSDTSDPERKDFSVELATLEERSGVEYVNQVAEGAMRSLLFTKRLWDQGGQEMLEYPEDTTPFTFRLYLGTENDNEEELPLANMYSYHVKDHEGYYCRWDANQQTFASLGKKDIDELTDEELTLATFTTSIYGSISKIPADHTVEVRNLIASTRYKIEERDYEIPRGYTLRLGDGYSRVDEGHESTTGVKPITGTIKINETPKIEVRNQKGWGLTVQKEWTDVDFMKSHDSIYFAVYLKNEDTKELTFLEDTVRELKSGQTEVYYFFENLETNKQFADYVIREVTLTPGAEGISVDSSGKVTGFESVTPIDEGGEIQVAGVTTNGTSSTTFTYNVNYAVGDQTLHNENVRTDTITNSRPGIELIKTDSRGNALPGAVFTLKDQNGMDVSSPTYTSGTNGRITIAYLAPGTYILTETVAPNRSAGLPDSLKIVVGDDYKVTLKGSNSDYYELENHPADSSMLATITIRNLPASFQIKKVDTSTGKPTPLKGVCFSLYPQVKGESGNPMKDYYPVKGYEKLVTNVDGVIGEITSLLDPGTYYLEETQTLEGYDLLDRDLCFTIGEDGTVTINDADRQSWLNKDTVGGNVVYSIDIPNERQKKFRFKKVDNASWRTSALAGAEFDLYRVEEGTRSRTLMYDQLTSNAEGILVYRRYSEFTLPVGTYELVETKAPAGYIIKTSPITIYVNPGNEPGCVVYDEGTTLSDDDSGISYNAKTRTYELLITNSTGYALPKTGGPGTLAYTVVGATLILVGAFGCVLRRRQNP